MVDRAAVQPLQAPMRATATPKNKVIAATTGAAVGSSVAVIFVWILQTILDRAGIHMDKEVATAFSVVFTAVVTMLAGYYTPPGASEGVLVDPNGNVKSALKD